MNSSPMLLLTFFLITLLLSCSVQARLFDIIKGIRDNPKFLDWHLKDDDMEDDQYIVILDDSTADVDSVMRDIVTLSGGELQYVYKNVFKGGAISNVRINKLRSFLDLDVVKNASPNAKIISDASYIQKMPPWGLDRLDQSGRSLNNKYQYSYDGTGVDIYIVDSGLSLSHAEFGGRASCGFSVFNDNCEDGAGHGTHVGGIAAGTTYGVAKNAQIIGVKVLDSTGSGSLADVFAGIEFVIGQHKASSTTKPAVLNMSLGGGFSTALNNAAKAAVDAGIVVVVAGGNSSRDACSFSPASSRTTITVGSIQRSDFRSGFSNVGPCIDIFAPGTDIISAFPRAFSNNFTISLSGTSMATPFVTGVAALHLQKNPIMSPSEVWTAMKNDGVQGKIRNRSQKGSPNLILGTTSLHDEPER